MYFALDRNKNQTKPQIVLTLSHAATQSFGQKAQNYQSHYTIWFHMVFF